MPRLAQSTLCARSSRFEGAVRKDLKTQVRCYRIILALTTWLTPHSKNSVYSSSSITCPSPPESMNLKSAYRRGENPYRSVVSGGSDASCGLIWLRPPSRSRAADS